MADHVANQCRAGGAMEHNETAARECKPNTCTSAPTRFKCTNTWAAESPSGPDPPPGDDTVGPGACPGH